MEFFLFKKCRNSRDTVPLSESQKEFVFFDQVKKEFAHFGGSK